MQATWSDLFSSHTLLQAKAPIVEELEDELLGVQAQAAAAYNSRVQVLTLGPCSHWDICRGLHNNSVG